MTPEEVQRLIAAFTRDEDYINSLSDAMYLHKVRVYEDTLSGLLGQYGYDDQDVQVTTEIAQALSDEADHRAEGIAATYNKQMEAFASGLADMDYAQAVETVRTWSIARDENRSAMHAIDAVYSAAADATALFAAAVSDAPEFEFGGHVGDAPPECIVCQAIEATNPHPMDEVLRIGSPHPQCRQQWHPVLDPGALPDDIDLGLTAVAGIVGLDSLVQRAGGQQQAVEELG